MKALSTQQTLSETVQDVQIKLQRMAEEQAENEQDEEKKEIFDWCSRVNPYEKHRNSKALRHPNTVLWFFDTPEFKKWSQNPGSAIWLYGIPGAGKTILTSAAIEEVKTMATKSSRHAVAYFYCEYRLPETQVLSNILGSLVRQVCACSSDAYLELEAFYSKCNEQGKQPTLPTCSEMEDLFKRLSQYFECLTVVIDGIDECSEHGDRLDILRTLSTLTSHEDGNIKVIYTSRNEIDIRRHFESFDSISIAARGNDLELYVAATIETRMQNKTLRMRDPALKEIIISTIVSKANGMFQWAKCQLDHICMLSTDKERRRALDTLPKDLFETYRRILLRVANSTESNKRLVKRTLSWVLDAEQPLHVDAIAKAITIEVDTDYLDPDDIPDEDSILKWCSSLIRKDEKSGIIMFSHFTVEEFLIDQKLQDDPELSEFHVNNSDDWQQTIAKTCLTYLNFSEFSRWDLTDWAKTEEDIDKDPFLEYAAVYWPVHARGEIQDTCFDLLCQLFAPTKSNNFVLWLQIYWPDRARGKAVPKAASTLHVAASLGLVEVCAWLLDQKVDINAQDPVMGTPLLSAILGLSNNLERMWMKRSPLVSMLLDRGARGDLYILESWTSPLKQNKKRRVTAMSSVLNIALWNRELCAAIFKDLLHHKAFSPFSESPFWLNSTQAWTVIPRPPATPRSLPMRSRDDLVEKALQIVVNMFRDILTDPLSESIDQPSVNKMISYVNLHGKSPSDDKLFTEISKREAIATSQHMTAEFAITATESGQTQVLETFISNGADPKLLSECLPAACRLGNTHLVRLLLGYCPSNDTIVRRYTRLSWIEATLAGQTGCLRSFLDNGFDVNTSVTHEMTGISPRSGSALAFAVCNGILESVVFLSGVPDIDFEITIEGCNLLHSAVEAPIHRKDILEILLQKNVDLSQCTKDGKTVLHSLLRNGHAIEDEDVALIRSLILRGCNPQHVDEQGHTLLHALLNRPHIFFALNLGNVIDLIDVERHMKNCTDKKGVLPLQMAVRGRAQDMVIRKLIPDDILLWNPPDYHGSSVLHALVMPGLTENPPPPPTQPSVLPRKRVPGPPPPPPFISNGSLADDTHILRILTILLDFDRVNVNIKNERGDTLLIALAIHCVESSSHKRALCLKLLLEHHADINACNAKNWTATHYLATLGYQAGMREVFGYNPNLLMLNDNGYSPLHQAICDGRLGSVQIWIERAKTQHQHCDEFRRSFEQPCSRGFLPIHIAARHRRTDIIVLLHDMHMVEDVNIRVESDGLTALHLAATTDDVASTKVLLKMGANIDALDKKSQTPLHIAASCGSATVAKLLVENGARTDIKNETGMLPWMITTPANQSLKTALEMAARGASAEQKEESSAIAGCSEAESQLAQDVDPVAELFKESIASRFLHVGPRGDETSMLEAVLKSRHYACLNLLKAGSNPDQVLNDKGETALHIACLKGSPGSWQILNHLLDFHATTAVKDETGDTALHNAAIKGRFSIAERLLKSGADIFARNDKMRTPLHLAAEAGSILTLKCLVDHVRNGSVPQQKEVAKPVDKESLESNHEPSGQVPSQHIRPIIPICSSALSRLLEAKDDERRTPLLTALCHGETEAAKYLIEQGANVDVITIWRRDALWLAADCGDKELVDILLSRGLDPNTSSYCFNALHQAADTEGHKEETVTEIALTLIKAGADMDSNNLMKLSALHCACNAGNVTLIKELLTRLPADEINVESKVCGTPLYCAAFRGYVEAVKILLDAGADINIGWKEESPLQAAIAQEHKEVIELLEDKDDGSTVTPTSSLHGSETSVEQELGDEISIISCDTAGS
ncbi:ankyrin [Mollisia scopiformis]|uniref:Ankyrin n=1 Tax=Mollisia scopiformis TaxID=149040 RepID=A0A132BD96_MOLSC|nr:ankyrin [Mollisia scopiformis]KUJ10376.1 ankyrin [Mollisia scopiformis]